MNIPKRFYSSACFIQFLCFFPLYAAQPDAANPNPAVLTLPLCSKQYANQHPTAHNTMGIALDTSLANTKKSLRTLLKECAQNGSFGKIIAVKKTDDPENRDLICFWNELPEDDHYLKKRIVVIHSFKSGNAQQRESTFYVNGNIEVEGNFTPRPEAPHFIPQPPQGAHHQAQPFMLPSPYLPQPPYPAQSPSQFSDMVPPTGPYAYPSYTPYFPPQEPSFYPFTGQHQPIPAAPQPHYQLSAPRAARGKKVISITEYYQELVALGIEHDKILLALPLHYDLEEVKKFKKLAATLQRATIAAATPVKASEAPKKFDPTPVLETPKDQNEQPARPATRPAPASKPQQSTPEPASVVTQTLQKPILPDTQAPQPSITQPQPPVPVAEITPPPSALPAAQEPLQSPGTPAQPAPQPAPAQSVVPEAIIPVAQEVTPPSKAVVPLSETVVVPAKPPVVTPAPAVVVPSSEKPLATLIAPAITPATSAPQAKSTLTAQPPITPASSAPKTQGPSVSSAYHKPLSFAQIAAKDQASTPTKPSAPQPPVSSSTAPETSPEKPFKEVRKKKKVMPKEEYDRLVEEKRKKEEEQRQEEQKRQAALAQQKEQEKRKQAEFARQKAAREKREAEIAAKHAAELAESEKRKAAQAPQKPKPQLTSPVPAVQPAEDAPQPIAAASDSKISKTEQQAIYAERKRLAALERALARQAATEVQQPAAQADQGAAAAEEDEEATSDATPQSSKTFQKAYQKLVAISEMPLKNKEDVRKLKNACKRAMSEASSGAQIVAMFQHHALTDVLWALHDVFNDPDLKKHLSNICEDDEYNIIFDCIRRIVLRRISDGQKIIVGIDYPKQCEILGAILISIDEHFLRKNESHLWKPIPDNDFSHDLTSLFDVALTTQTIEGSTMIVNAQLPDILNTLKNEDDFNLFIAALNRLAGLKHCEIPPIFRLVISGIEKYAKVNKKHPLNKALQDFVINLKAVLGQAETHPPLTPEAFRWLKSQLPSSGPAASSANPDAPAALAAPIASSATS